MKKLSRVCATLALALGCSSFDLQDNEAASDVGSDRAALHGGLETAARPEVGKFSRGCTAVLVDSRHVLTSAHCLNVDNYQDSRVRPTDSYRPADRFDPRALGPAVSVERIYSFGIDLGEHTSTGWLSTDLALLRLSAPIDGTVVLPAAISRISPDHGVPVTAMGYGCTDTLDSGVAKNAFSYLFDRHGLRNVCKGDSGGPQLLGHLFDNGPVWGITSGWWSGGAFGWDFFGDAPWVKPHVAALVHQWNGHPFELDVERQGLDFAVPAAADAAGCLDHCTADERCMSFSFDQKFSLCHLKQGLADWVPRVGFISGENPLRTRSVEVGVERPGAAYWSFEPPVAFDPGECAKVCASEARCRAYTYAHPIVTGGNGKCSLKEEVPPGRLSVEHDSGVKFGLELEAQRTGAGPALFPVNNQPEYCQSACFNDTSCVAWTWFGAIPGGRGARCGLHFGLTPAIASVFPGSARAVTGIKDREFF